MKIDFDFETTFRVLFEHKCLLQAWKSERGIKEKWNKINRTKREFLRQSILSGFEWILCTGCTR